MFWNVQKWYFSTFWDWSKFEIFKFATFEKNPPLLCSDLKQGGNFLPGWKSKFGIAQKQLILEDKTLSRGLKPQKFSPAAPIVQGKILFAAPWNCKIFACGAYFDR